ncbi:MAG: hypothetical protein JWQ43_2545 [Glaciihabitans sp.]|nr:hypothetical protein [Glaciihabitans sp.]
MSSIERAAIRNPVRKGRSGAERLPFQIRHRGGLCVHKREVGEPVSGKTIEQHLDILRAAHQANPVALDDQLGSQRGAIVLVALASVTRRNVG